MTDTTALAPATRLRLWPGLVIIALQWLVIKVPAWWNPGSLMQFMAGFWGPLIAILALVIWWLFFSRVPWLDRVLAIVVCAAAAGVAACFIHSSYVRGLFMFGLPVAATVWVLWLLISMPLSWPVRRVGLLAALVAVWGYQTLLRLDGVDGSFGAQVSWRWEPTAEDRFLAERGQAKPAAAPTAGSPGHLAPGDWPGFRGPDRDGRLPGVRIATDWNERPPRQVWRHRVGPGWSSFAAVGGRLYTQEQRGDNEVVVCYLADTGEEAWVHEDATRFTEVVAGPGPRATPTFHDGKLFTLGANGRLNCLEAATGKPVWSRDIVEDSRAKVPTWGFAASPLVVDGIVTVFAGGPDGKAVLGYKETTGELAWAAGEGSHGYGSTHRARLGGIEQVLILSDHGLTAFHPTRGDILWKHPWPVQEGLARILQPAILDDTDVLAGTWMEHGTRRLRITRSAEGWEPTEVWTTKAIKPYFSDFVIHQGHLYGFNGIFFTCVRLEDGKGLWRARGYGNGQVLLLVDQGLLLILSETGEAALVRANPEQHEELGRFAALQGKTWNHPVVVGGKLFVRNGEEAACYDIAEAGPTSGGERP